MIKKESVYRVLGTVISVSLGVSAITAVYLYYRNYVWRPNVTVGEIDWNTGTATLIFGNKNITLYAGSVVAAGFRWGVRFAKSNIQATGYDRIELVKDDEVYTYLAQRQNQ